MRVLVGCEESGKVRDAFAALGWDAWSNDLIPARNGGQHLQMCVMEAITQHGPWDVIILHPECTAMTVSGNSTYGRGQPKHQQRLDAVAWTKSLWQLAKEHARVGCVLENPVGVLFAALDGELRYYQPYQFGHMEQKKTGLLFHGLRPIAPTNDVYAAMMQLPKNQRERLHYMPPGPNRKRDRSETFQGIANALAQQITEYVKGKNQ